MRRPPPQHRSARRRASAIREDLDLVELLSTDKSDREHVGYRYSKECRTDREERRERERARNINRD